MSDNKDIEAPATKAVAVKGDQGGDTPRIVAKGQGFNAEKILDIAFAEGVMVRQDRDLTELLDAFEVESPVPLEALNAVSMILDRVYQENRRLESSQKSGAASVMAATAPKPETPADAEIGATASRFDPKTDTEMEPR